ncbi:hypothetical protein CBM2589_U10159 [Cupriavidus taiwanensis]|uniref:Uncharacterized protein n=1 Tax=Cupriavidus taiwanensis TaxID=164546 RepID=A0A375CQY0_9BURK|nr:hypothetical protein [Cupriavidus taiwanensis]SOY77657.1 hypothetical protein CBM2589_U10159 [Cupriavidus taiwanensis]
MTMNQTQFATAQLKTEVLDDLWNVFQDLLADGGKEKIEIEQGALGEKSVPDEVLARVLEASQVIDDEPALQPLEDGDLYIAFG